MLRTWQSECIRTALEKYSKGQTHFFCQATPGSGKTVMAANVAQELLDRQEIDLILCFSPSITVAKSIQSTFAATLKCAFNGGLGSLGASYTYQSIKYLDDTFWQTIQKYRVFAVFDEIHHCSFDENGGSNAWGEQVICKVQRCARYTLALSGTPWRSDCLPIAMAQYSDPEGKLVCDYQYGLQSAVKDNVCRRPKIVLIDNESLSVQNGGDATSFSSIAALLKETKTSYQNIIHNQEAVRYALHTACEKLSAIREHTPNAAGLVVAASVAHAKWIQQLLQSELAQTTKIVTYHHPSPLEEIERFRHSNAQWIVSVGMISEGTDIPRLQVCCHLSSVKTELYFRQVLGRILRVTQNEIQHAWLYTFAEERLIEFAERIEEDIPESCQYVYMGQLERQQIDVATQKGNAAGSNIQQSTNSSTLIWSRECFDEVVNGDITISQDLERIKLGRYRKTVIAAFG